MNRHAVYTYKKILFVVSAIAITLLLSAFNEGKSGNKKSNPSGQVKPDLEKLGDEVKCGTSTKIYENPNDAAVKVKVYVTDRCLDRDSVVKIFDEKNNLTMNFMVGYIKSKSRTVLVPTKGYIIFDCNGSRSKNKKYLFKCTYKVTELL